MIEDALANLLLTLANILLTLASLLFLYNQYTGLHIALPPNVHLLTLDQFHHNGPVPSPSGTVPYLIRLEHFYEAEEDPDLSKPVTFDIQVLMLPVCGLGMPLLMYLLS